MANLIIDRPIRPGGDSQKDLEDMYRYLCRISEQLSQAMVQVTEEQEATVQQIVETVTSSGGQMQKKSTEYSTLKSLIIKTAEVIHSEMDAISTTLETNYKAVSEQFGTLETNLRADFEATAKGIVQEYEYDEKIETLQGESEDAKSYIRNTSAYIFSGLIDEENGTYGIAIGQNIAEQDEDGNWVLDNNNKVATFTADRMSFYMNGTEVAYFSNNQFFINEGIINRSLKMGNFAWKVLTDKAIALTKA